MIEEINEKTLVLLKPDAVQKNLIGRIISRFEESGLKICAMKMTHASKSLAEKHYPLDDAWAENVFKKRKAVAEKEGKPLEYKDASELAKLLQSWLLEYITESPIIAVVLEGPHAIELVRKIVGHTEPRQALPGTIRSDFASIESYKLADLKKRATRNLIHGSDSVENAQKEIALWFKSNEIHDYKRDQDRL